MTQMAQITIPSFSSNGRVSLEDGYLLTRQLHVLQKAGVPLLSGLKALETQLPSSALRPILRDVHQHIMEGRTFSQALARHPKVFGPVFVSLIRVGEAGGLLTEILEQLTRLYEWEIDLRQRLSAALQYPIIVLCTLSAAIVIMASFVLPRFGQMFTSFRIPLPFQTRMLIALSDFMAAYWWLMLLLGIGMGVAWWMFLQTERGRLRWHTWKLRLPVLGQIFLQLAMSRFARITAALNHAGVPILETLELAGQSVNNRAIRVRLDRVRGKVQGGAPLASAMKAEPIFPPVVVQMVATGEETGRIDELLHSVSEYYDQQVAYTVKRLITYLEPTLLLVVGLGVLLMATAVFVPMWDLVKIFKTTGR
ncbi:MAG: type II secretion system F family protein [Candidatus Omnitrophota bacterium]|nr:type II secretion system F family protein [Candidatus Omnitrophota bacterium]